MELDDSVDTWSRADLLAARGYDQDIVAGNGHHANGDHAARSDQGGDQSVDKPIDGAPPIGVASPGPACSQCDQPAVPGRPTCGAKDCVDAHRRASKRSRYAAARAELPAGSTRAPTPVLTQSTPAVLTGALAVVPAGAVVTRVEYTLAGEAWYSARVTNGRSPL